MFHQVSQFNPNYTVEDADIEISHEEFCSATKLKNKLASHRLALEITDTYLGELWQHLFRMNFPNTIKSPTGEPTRLGIRKSENRGFSDLPLFNHSDRQQNLLG